MSLADVYNVEGSIAGVDQLESREVQLVHEMGGTIFSERFGSNIMLVETAAIAQSLSFDIVAPAVLSTTVQRILGVVVFANQAGRVAHAQVSVRDPTAGREVPIWFFDDAVDLEATIRIENNGAGAAAHTLFRPVQLFEGIPSLVAGTDQRSSVEQIVLRGTTTAFGAGTVVTTAVVLVAFSAAAGLSSRGLPIPSW